MVKEHTEYIAHARENPSTPNGFDIHSLEDHLRKVAKQAQEFAKEFNAGDWAYPAGLWHDLGKYRATFQAYIQRGTGINPDPDAHIEKDSDPRTNHASSGAIYSRERLGNMGLPLAYIIAGHHAGLPDYEGGGEAKGAPLREVLERDKPLLEEALREKIPDDILVSDYPATAYRGNADAAHLWIRMLFSCLVDADFLDTESFMSPHESAQRPTVFPLEKLPEIFNQHMDSITQKSQKSSVNKLRAEILSQCRHAAANPPGIFTLTVPTGGGKTLSSLAFALEHAVHYKKRRIIYAIPYTSIIDQTAKIFSKIFSDLGDIVLEHHSNIEPDKESRENHKSRLATENWDAPIIVTTTVQLFESLFAARTSRCRKLHNMVNSVIVLDETQLLPLQHLAPIRKVMALLAKHYGITFVLSTATPTGLNKQTSPFGKKLLEGLDSKEIIDGIGKYYAQLKRVLYKLPKPADFQNPRSWAEIADELAQYDSVLVIVNKRQDAKELFDLMPRGTYHLSALMCAAHRTQVIEEIRTRLRENKPTRVISTQLVEAGVDFDFPVVYRAMAGLDSIVQAGGRCNREGLLPDVGKVVVFVPPSSPPKGTISTAIRSCRSVLSCLDQHESIDSPEVFERYFNHLFAQVETDSANMYGLLERDAGIQFRTAALKFRMIDDDNTHTVYVRYGGEADAWLKKLKSHPSRELLRKLQPYSVTVYNYQFNAMLNRGDIEEMSSGFYAQSGGDIYDDKLGLLVGGI